MDLEQQLRASLAPIKPRPELHSSILARVSTDRAAARSNGRGRNRTILVGTILAVAAAAAMLGLNLVNGPEPQVADAAPAIEPAAVSTLDQSPASEQALSETHPATAVESEVAVPAAKAFTVRVLPLQNQDAEAAVRVAVDKFYTAFREKLRAVPGLSLVPAVADPAGAVLPDFELTIRGGKVDGPQGRIALSVAGDDKRMQQIKQLRKEAKEELDGSSFASSMVNDMVPGMPEETAARMIDMLRKRIFPEDPAYRAQFVSKLLDGSLDQHLRAKALVEIGEFRGASAQATHLRDSVVVRGALSLAGVAADPAVRAQVWRSLQGSRDSALLEPATAALWQESDADIRQQLVMLLTEGFSSEQRARDALEQVARAESRPLTRALAQRALTGESSWRQYVMSSLQDVARSDSERMEAFMYYFFPPGQSPGSMSASGLLGRSQELFDDKSIRALAQLLPGIAGSSDSRSKAMMVVSELSSMRKSEVNVMLLDLIDKQIDAGIKSLVVDRMGSYSNDPAVRTRLEKIAAANPDPQLRALASKALQATPYSAADVEAMALSAAAQSSPREIIANNDLDKDGIVTRQEADKNGKYLSQRWDSFDINKDGRVDADEAAQAMESPAPTGNQANGVPASSAVPRTSPETIIANNDLNKDGIVTREEADRSGKNLAQTWDSYDLNKDGKVDVAEVALVRGM